MGRGSRDRVTIELCGMRERLQSLSAARAMTPAALVRKALAASLDCAPCNGEIADHETASVGGGQVVKVTVRLSEAHAVALATRARAAGVSKGAYVAGLINGTPPGPLSIDHSRTVAALMGSTDQLAAMAADLNAFMRTVSRVTSSQLEPHRASIGSLVQDIRSHLAQASELVAELRSTRRAR